MFLYIISSFRRRRYEKTANWQNILYLISLNLDIPNCFANFAHKTDGYDKEGLFVGHIDMGDDGRTGTAEIL
jgi:hypothetical protein